MPLQVQKGRDDVMLEFPADDTAGGDHEDALCEMSFHVPKESDRFGGEETTSAAEVTRRCTLPHSNAACWAVPKQWPAMYLPHSAMQSC